MKSGYPVQFLINGIAQTEALIGNGGKRHPDDRIFAVPVPFVFYPEPFE
jgi:hypothetical protein